MKIPAIKALLAYDLDTLRKAEQAIEEGETPEIEVGGVDEGDQLTNVFGAIWIKEEIKKGAEEKEALRAFTKKVRNSIS
ncbi:hypothetical protein HZ996_09805 [Cryomorphaceae bacterium]|nr:hypothetical protein HZ996_09805 [Cryomorphaceae bacterium]